MITHLLVWYLLCGKFYLPHRFTVTETMLVNCDKGAKDITVCNRVTKPQHRVVPPIPALSFASCGMLLPQLDFASVR